MSNTQQQPATPRYTPDETEDWDMSDAREEVDYERPRSFCFVHGWECEGEEV